jgi:hypothetical protein
LESLHVSITASVYFTPLISSLEFICDTLTNSCKANQSAKDICAKAQTAATAAAAKTGAQADAFNSVFGIKSVSFHFGYTVATV